MKISVVLPVYNGESYIAKSIESVQRQTYKNWELIIINDGSTDSSEQIAQKYAQSDARIRLISQENQGVSAARNLGISEATGNALIFLDADDWFEKDAFLQVADHWDTSTQLLLFDYYNVTKHRKKQFQKNLPKSQLSFGADSDYSMDVLTLLMSGFYTWRNKFLQTPWAKAWSVKAIKDMGLRFPGKIFASEDQVFCVNACAKLENAKYISVPIYNYYLNDASITHVMYQKNGERLIANIESCNQCIKEIFKEKHTKLFENAYYKYIYEGVKIILWWIAEETDTDKRALGRAYCYQRAKQILSHFCKEYSITDRVLISLCVKKCFWLVERMVKVRKRMKHLLQAR